MLVRAEPHFCTIFNNAVNVATLLTKSKNHRLLKRKNTAFPLWPQLLVLTRGRRKCKGRLKAPCIGCRYFKFCLTNVYNLSGAEWDRTGVSLVWLY